MPLTSSNLPHIRMLFLTFACAMLSLAASAASCKTQSQMTVAERDALASAARIMVREVQSGDAEALKANTIPAVAADFGGIVGSVANLNPLVRDATITVDSLYALDASTQSAGAGQTDFYCGSPLVVLNFTSLPPGSYALVLLHATGVSQPQQISLILSETAEHRWMLAGFFSKPMTEAGHDGLWYWVSARRFAKQNMNWDAWFYYRTAANFLNPVEFLSSPNLEKLQHEEEEVHPGNLPGVEPVMLSTQGSVFQVTAIDTTAALGALDLEVHYTPDAAETAQLRDPPAARKQVTQVMTALLALHPELQAAFHGIWAYADQGSASLFSLELPMDQIVPVMETQATSSSSANR
ncbi:MAG: hypothetical protein ABSG51_14295 [Terracidiphilus sp.]